MIAMPSIPFSTFVSIWRERLNCDWKIVFDGELDVPILEWDEPATVRGMLDSPLVTLHVVDANPTDQPNPPEHLVRPLRYEAFIDALSAPERRFAASGSAAAAPAVRHPKLAPARNPVPPPGAQLRLLRWPAHALLHGDRAPGPTPKPAVSVTVASRQRPQSTELLKDGLFGSTCRSLKLTWRQ